MKQTADALKPLGKQKDDDPFRPPDKTPDPKPKPATTTDDDDNDKDSGPSLAERMQRDATKKAGEQAQKSLDKFKGSAAGRAIRSPSASKEQKDALERTSEVIRDMQRGVQRGFRKGGLASRRK
jgi:hypothetical protein